MSTAGTVQRHHAPVTPRQKASEQRSSDAAQERPSSIRQLMSVLLMALMAWAAYLVAVGKYYTPRSGFGFYIGVIGTLMMLALLAYPLRKHVPWMQRWGALKHWFRIHMIMGIIGPTLVLFHSTFHIRSTNAAVALASMLGVVISGVVGRFVYTKIHYGLYGSRATLEKVREEFAGQADEAKSRLHFAPRVEQWLHSFERKTTRPDRSLGASAWHFLTLGLTRSVIEFRCARELQRLLRSERRPEFQNEAPEAIALVSSYLREVERVAHFTIYERLFSLWHVVHIPLIYLLAASTMFHILAAYMY
ncbi:MAG TPA: hypothetical protein VF443_08695 [Nitrospira sp.]